MKSDVEARHLDLQNLLYEKTYLLQEIHRCRAFDLTETNKIELVRLEEFRDKAPAELKLQTDEHSTMLNRLAFELLQRRELVKELRQLKEDRSKVQQLTNQQQAWLAKLPGHLVDIEKATLPLQEYLDINVTKRTERHAECRKLPTPLYVLYNQLEAYGDVYQGVSVSVHTVEPMEISPGKQQAEARTVREQMSPGTKKSQPGNRKKRKKPSDEDEEDDTDGEIEAEQEETDPFQPHAQVVKAELRATQNLAQGGASPRHTDSAAVQAKLRFEYLPSLNVVTVVAENNEALLANLFPNDTGEYLPRTDATYMAKKTDHLALSFPEDYAGRPYKWAQWLAGLDYLDPLSPDSNHPTTRQIVDSVLERIYAQESLGQQLETLRQRPHPIPVPDKARRFFAGKEKTRLVSWEELRNTDDLFERPPRSHSTVVPVFRMKQDKEARAAEYGKRCFLVKFNTSGSNECPKTVQAVVSVYTDYPKHVPKFTILDMEKAGAVKQDLWIIQNEVNSFTEELRVVGNTRVDIMLLSLQLRRLQMCLDVLCGDVDKAKLSSFGRTKRGRDRRLAFVFDPETQRFKHR